MQILFYSKNSVIRRLSQNSVGQLERKMFQFFYSSVILMKSCFIKCMCDRSLCDIYIAKSNFRRRAGQMFTRPSWSAVWCRALVRQGWLYNCYFFYIRTLWQPIQWNMIYFMNVGPISMYSFFLRTLCYTMEH